MAEIQKVKRIEKEITFTNSEKIIAFTKKWHIINNTVPWYRWFMLAQKIFNIETGKLLLKTLLEKRLGLGGYPFFYVCCLFRLFVRLFSFESHFSEILENTYCNFYFKV